MSYSTTVIRSKVLSGNIWQELEPELEPKLWTKVEPESEPKMNNFASTTLLKNTFFLVRRV